MMLIANPIYDAVFKYLLQDDRIARIILSALLKQKVVNVQMRPHEYPKVTKKELTMFRIDFGAKVIQENGEENLILIELQKTWLDTEVLRYRQYVGTQYMNEENVVTTDSDKKGFGVPMVTVYLLGHKVGNIDEPVLYIHHKAFDYDGNPVEKGIPDKFIDSLTHDMVLVQIPLLKGALGTRLDGILDIFNQDNATKRNPKVMAIDETKYLKDPDMYYILHRLEKAAEDAYIRQEMNVEDEFFMAIDNRDDELQRRSEQIKAKDIQLRFMDEQIQVKDEQIQELDVQIQERDVQIEQKNEALVSSAKALKEAGVKPEQIIELTKLAPDVIAKL